MNIRDSEQRIIIAKIRNGDKEARENYILHYYERIKGTLVRLQIPEEYHEDILHDCIIAVMGLIEEIDLNKQSHVCQKFNIKIIERERFSTCFYKDVIITLAGPAFNIICFIILYRVYNNFAFVNLFVGLFNLLPAATLDGGQLIYLFLLKRYNAEFSAKVIDIITIIIAFPLLLIGILVLLYSKYNFSLLFIALYLVFTLFIRDEKYL